jgi:hypothetical protein
LFLKTLNAQKHASPERDSFGLKQSLKKSGEPPDSLAPPARHSPGKRETGDQRREDKDVLHGADHLSGL